MGAVGIGGTSVVVSVLHGLAYQMINAVARVGIQQQYYHKFEVHFSVLGTQMDAVCAKRLGIFFRVCNTSEK